MATKIPTTELKVGMFVADPDRPWVDTPFLLQGFLIEDEDQIRALMQHCHFVLVDRTRSTGDQYQAPTAARAGEGDPGARIATVSTGRPSATSAGAPWVPGRDASPPPARTTPRGRGPDVIVTRSPYSDGLAHAAPGAPGGLFGRIAAGFKGLWQKEQRTPARRAVEPPKETPQEFEARAALAPPGVTITTY